MRLARGSNMIALSLADNQLCIGDIDAMRVIRRVPLAHSGTVTDMCFSADCHWVITAGDEGCVKVSVID